MSSSSSHVKSLSTDHRSKNRIRFASSKQRAARATADVYRTSKRHRATTSVAAREDAVHSSSSAALASISRISRSDNDGGSSRPWKRARHATSSGKGEKQIVYATTKDDNKKKQKEDDDAFSHASSSSLDSAMQLSTTTTTTSFATELDVALDRNASEIFAAFHREIWHLVRSLPEILHHAETIVQILLSYLVSLEIAPGMKAVYPPPPAERNAAVVANEENNGDEDDDNDQTKQEEHPKERPRYTVNHATQDILHLLAVLARDLRHELHPFLHTMILPRILYDLLHPPPPTPTEVSQGKQPIPLDVTVVEAAFRCVSYLLKYDAEYLLKEFADSSAVKDPPPEHPPSHEPQPCLEPMRQYYGVTLAHKRELVRRLAAEAFAPLIRKLPWAGQKRHLKHVLKALAGSARTKNGNAKDEQSPAVQRLQVDAVDGIAQLIFELVRGVQGRLHSKGIAVIKCVFSALVSTSQKQGGGDHEDRGQELVFQVVSNVLERVSRYVEPARAGDSLSALMEQAQELLRKEELPGRSLSYILSLLDDVTCFGNGKIIAQHGKASKELTALLESLLDQELFLSLSFGNKTSAINLLCSVWRYIPDQEKFYLVIRNRLSSVIKASPFREDQSDRHDSRGELTSTPAFILARKLVPHLPSTLALQSVGSIILSVAAQLAPTDESAALSLGCAIVSSTRERYQIEDGEEYQADDSDRLWNLSHAKYCKITENEREALLDLCLVDLDTIQWSENECRRLSNMILTASFVSLASSGDFSSSKLSSTYRRISKWLLRLMSCIVEDGKYESEDASSPHLCVVASFALEAFSNLSTQVLDRLDAETVKTQSIKAREYALKHVLARPGSIWRLKSVASFVSLLSQLELHLSDESSSVFDALSPNLSHQNHFIRLHTLEILNCFPVQHFVTDHADLDLTDDLDEESSSRPVQSMGNAPGTIYRSGPCDLLTTLLQVESIPPSVQNERRLQGLLAHVEVIGRTGKVPVCYAEASSYHMLGLLHVKFSPIWQPAVNALVALYKGQVSISWPAIQSQILAILNEPAVEVTMMHPAQSSTEVSPADGIVESSVFFQRCVAWEVSNGKDSSLFADDIRIAADLGRVSRHERTDEATVFSTAWSVLEKAPQIITSHSRVLVPSFLRFMQDFYFMDNRDDIELRELNLPSILNDELEHSRPCHDRSTVSGVNRFAVQARLVCILRAFSTVNGPQQMFKHTVLRSIFVSLLTHPEVSVSKLAFSCLLRFKDSELVPHAECLARFFEKGKFRQSLIEFKAMVESKPIPKADGSLLIPVISRILFGRLSARSSGKSSKDSPATRRNAVLSFLSNVCDQDNDLYSFLYFMVRNYLPLDFPAKMVEQHDEKYQTNLLQALVASKPEAFVGISNSVHQGFLNMMDAALSQLGYRVQAFLPAFISITLSIAKLVEVKTTRAEAEPHEEDDTDAVDPNDSSRRSAVRSLCFRRLSDLLDKFHDGIDADSFAGVFWPSVHFSLLQLPESVVNSDRVPALLSLLHTLSRHPSLHRILELNSEVARAIFKCLSDTSRSQVVDTVMNIVQNLLADESTIGSRVIRSNLDVFLMQCKLRLHSGSDSPVAIGSKSSTQIHQTWRRELDILCRVSNLLDDQYTRNGGSPVIVLESLCDLLVPYLTRRGASEVDRLNVIGILKSLLPRISPTSAPERYSSLSRLFGTEKAKSIVVSKGVRLSLASLVNVIADKLYPTAKPASELLTRLCSFQSGRRVDELDYDAVIPALNELAGANSGGWAALSHSNQPQQCQPSLLLPLAHTSFHLLGEEDGVVSRTAFKALKDLVHVAAVESGIGMRTERDLTDYNELWRKFLEGCIIPLARSGIHARDPTVRRYYVLIFSEVCRHCKGSTSENFYGDLAALINDQEPDLDFFLNITHVQIHRRARALQRLRKLIASEESPGNGFCQQSLSNVLLPLAIHPIYESKTKIEESLALEAIATVGAISRHLSWSKYNATLWTTLNQFQRHSEQERYLIGMICAIVDGFHFEVLSSGRNATLQEDGTAVWRALEKRIIPKVESLFIKEKTDKDGAKIKTLRPSIVLALTKLFQKVPREYFVSQLPRLLTIVCDVLRSRESNARDLARSTLAKMVVEMDLAFLPDVVRELAITLTEGYRLHVRTATIHSILLGLSSERKLPLSLDSGWTLSEFDRAVPALIDLLQQDLFGGAQERRDADGNHVRYVKEAGGSKSYHALELIASMIYFKPSARSFGLSFSAVHALVSPFLERLRDHSVAVTVTRRIGECLSRIVVGLSRNESVELREVLLFTYATMNGFIAKSEVSEVINDADCESDDEDTFDFKPIVVTGSKLSTGNEPRKKHSRAVVAQWSPSTLDTFANSSLARKAKLRTERERALVQDGALAPKLTGSNRNDSDVKKTHEVSINDAASIAAIIFGLKLMHASLKKSPNDLSDEIKSMLDPFIPQLATCLCLCRDQNIVLLSMRILGLLLRTDLPSLHKCVKPLACKALDLLTSSGSAANQNQEILQASFKMLTFLLEFERRDVLQKKSSVQNDSLPLNDEQMQVLLHFLQNCIVESDQHNPALGLLRAVMTRRYVSPELYDLMETMLEQTARSPKLSLRQQSSSIFVKFLLNYPLTEERIEQHLKQIILNISYEHVDGRLSAIALANMVTDKLPTPLLDKHAQLLFLPLTLQLVNDDVKDCREAVSKCLASLIQNVSIEILQSLFDYIVRWSNGEPALRRTAIQLFGILMESREDFVKRHNVGQQVIDTIQASLNDESDNEDWQIRYFALVCLQKSSTALGEQIIVQRREMWSSIIQLLQHEHAWVKIASSRLLTAHLTSLDCENLSGQASKTFLFSIPGVLHELARGYCYQLNAEEENIKEELVTLNVKALTWLVRAMTHQPKLCFQKEDDSESNRNPVQWVVMRLSNIAKRKGHKRRSAVYKCFAAFATYCMSAVEPHLQLLLEPLYRSEIETQNELELATKLLSNQHHNQKKQNDPTNNELADEAQLAKDVIFLLEEKCASHDAFLSAYAAVKASALEKREQRKLATKTEVVTDPQAAAKRRIHKQEQEKNRRKRRVDERRKGRGGSKKQRFTDE